MSAEHTRRLRRAQGSFAEITIFLLWFVVEEGVVVVLFYRNHMQTQTRVFVREAWWFCVRVWLEFATGARIAALDPLLVFLVCCSHHKHSQSTKQLVITLFTLLTRSPVCTRTHTRPPARRTNMAAAAASAQQQQQQPSCCKQSSATSPASPAAFVTSCPAGQLEPLGLHQVLSAQ